MKAIGFIGPSGSGKTTLIERLIPLLVQRGLKVSALKHAHHGFDIDRAGKDSFRFRVAGAAQVLIAAPQRWALMTELRGREAGLDELLSELAPCDLVLVEGFRSEGSIPRIEVCGASAGLPAVAPPSFAPDGAREGKPGAQAGPNLVAIVCDDPIDSALPRFARDDAAAIAAFIVAHLGIG
jgi:molybdopterin-guanine dinucleotide biosynthesis protein B